VPTYKPSFIHMGGSHANVSCMENGLNIISHFIVTSDESLVLCSFCHNTEWLEQAIMC